MLEMQYNVLYLLQSTHVQSTSKNVSGKVFTVIKHYYNYYYYYYSMHGISMHAISAQNVDIGHC